jgi:thiamine pyrophosphokinase
MLTLILANGDLTDTTVVRDLFFRADLIIAVDGGGNHCSRWGIIPDILIGDLDSINPAVLREYQKNAVAIHRHPPRKDATDLELALDLIITKGAREVYLLGGLGGRWDMSLANILLCSNEKYRALRLTVLGPGCVMHILHPGNLFTLYGTPGQQVSFLPLQDEVRGLTLRGFEYSLQDATLLFGSTQGASNILQEPKATVLFHSGILLCIHLTDAEHGREVRIDSEKIRLGG